MAEDSFSVEAEPIWAVLKEVPSMLAYWDRDLLCRFANPAYERWFGRKGSSLFGTSIRDLLGPELFALNEPHIRAALSGKAQQFERIVPGPGGVSRPSLACYIPHVVGGKVLGFVVQVTEVTALYAAREELKEQVAECGRAKALLQKARDELEIAQRLGEMGSWTWDIDQDIIDWSPQLYEIFGWERDRPLPTFEEQATLYTATSMAILTMHVRRAIDFGLPYTLELEYFHRSGRQGWLEARGAAQRDATGRVTGLHGTAQEITARRAARQSAAQSAHIDELERELADACSRNGVPASPMQPGVQLEDSTRVSRAVERPRSAPERLAAVRASGLLDTPAEESFDGLTSLAARMLKVPACFISIVDEKRDFYKSQIGLPADIARGLKGRTLCHYTLERQEALIISDTQASKLWRAVPTVRELGVRAYIGVPLILNGQNIGSFCAIDMVPRPWNDGELEMLRQLSISATREIALRAAMKASEAMEAAACAQALEKERLVAVVAHDLRTPLQILQLATHLIQRDSSNERARVTARMQSALTMMKTMIDGLMRENADATTVRLPVNVTDLAQDSLEMMAPIAQRASISLSLAEFPDATVRVDYGQMLRVLGNLVGNAIKYSPAGSSVHLSCRRGDGTVRLSVCDNGVGMDESEVALAFDRGWQGVEAQARGDGAGLGLAIVKTLVAQQSGTVSLESRPGEGTVVTVTLPCW